MFLIKIAVNIAAPVNVLVKNLVREWVIVCCNLLSLANLYCPSIFELS